MPLGYHIPHAASIPHGYLGSHPDAWVHNISFKRYLSFCRMGLSFTQSSGFPSFWTEVKFMSLTLAISHTDSAQLRPYSSSKIFSLSHWNSETIKYLGELSYFCIKNNQNLWAILMDFSHLLTFSVIVTLLCYRTLGALPLIQSNPWIHYPLSTSPASTSFPGCRNHYSWLLGSSFTFLIDVNVQCLSFRICHRAQCPWVTSVLQ